MHHCDDSWRRVTMTRRCIRAVFAAFLLISVFNAGRFENETTAPVDAPWLNVADNELVSSQLSATEDVNATADVDVTEAVSADENDSWNLLERVRVFSTMTTSYNWSARFDDRDRENTWTIVMAYTYWRGYFGSLSVQNGAAYITTAIEDYCTQNNNGLEHYYFE